jgi:hypothetical protein
VLSSQSLMVTIESSNPSILKNQFLLLTTLMLNKAVWWI